MLTSRKMIISFYADVTQDDENQPPKFDLEVIMPQGWIPKMYLAALNKAVRRHLILSLELIIIEGQIYATIKELQGLFLVATEEVTHSQLIHPASYIHVSDGVLKKVEDILN
jgi:hypothetical protein